MYWYGMFNVVEDSLDIIKKDGALRIVEHIDIETWKEFMSRLAQLKKQFVVYTDCVPDTYKSPKNVTLINLHSVSLDVSSTYRGQLVPEQNYDDIEYDYFLPSEFFGIVIYPFTTNPSLASNEIGSIGDIWFLSIHGLDLAMKDILPLFLS